MRNFTYDRITRLEKMLIDVYDLVAQERLKNDISSREVAARKLGLFVDPFIDDDLRDQGIAQTAAYRRRQASPCLLNPRFTSFRPSWKSSIWITAKSLSFVRTAAAAR